MFDRQEKTASVASFIIIILLYFGFILKNVVYVGMRFGVGAVTVNFRVKTGCTVRVRSVIVI